MEYLLSGVYVLKSKESINELEILFYSSTESKNVLLFDGVEFHLVANNTVELERFENNREFSEYISSYRGPIYIIDIRQNLIGDIFYVKLANQDLFKISFSYDNHQEGFAQIITLVTEKDKLRFTPTGKSVYDSEQETFENFTACKLD